MSVGILYKVLLRTCMMSISIVSGVKGLIQLGVSLGDLAVILRIGRVWGNWLKTGENDNELFESILELPDALLKRGGLIDAARMESRWSGLDFIYKGRRLKHAGPSSKNYQQHLGSFSWLMVVLVTCLDVCLPSSAITSLLIDVFVSVLKGDKEMEDSIVVQLPTNIRSWRSTGCVRGMVSTINNAMKGTRSQLAHSQAVPQLNPVECDELRQLLVWLLEGESQEFHLGSATNYALVEAMKQAGVHVSTTGERRYEGEPVVKYLGDPRQDMSLRGNFSVSDFVQDSPLPMAQIVAYPRGSPKSMIEAITVPRDVQNKMDQLWDMGVEAARQIKLDAEATLPYSTSSDIEYGLDGYDRATRRYDAKISMLAGHGFPRATQSVLHAIETLVAGASADRITWLHQHTSLEYLQRGDFRSSVEPENAELLIEFQALLFGFYYRLFEDLISIEAREDAYFRGSWGLRSNHFLTACVGFGDTFVSTGKVSRTHILYMLSTMYDGRSKIYSSQGSPPGLIGVLGNISILSNSLLRTTDNPRTIASFTIVDLPLVDLMSDPNGELYASKNTNNRFFAANSAQGFQAQEIRPGGPPHDWSVHPKMGIFSGEDQTGIMMAARCSGTLVGHFSPLAADVAFLSPCYQSPRHKNEPGWVDQSTIKAIEIRDDHWQKGIIPRPVPDTNQSFTVLAIHSKDCPPLRYAATGIYTEAREEVVIATDDIEAAFRRVVARNGNEACGRPEPDYVGVVVA
jgi:hypothetical protein